MKTHTTRLIVFCAACFAISPAVAQRHAALEQQDESSPETQEASGAEKSTTDEKADHDRHPAETEQGAIDHSKMDHGKMDHGEMDHSRMQHGEVETTSSPMPSDHVAPPPPQHPMRAMSEQEMTEVMGMDDKATFGMFKLDRLERVKTDDGYATAWNAEGWLGGDFDKLWFKSEGERRRGEFEHADAQLLWSHAVAPYWDTQLGVRRDFGAGPDRSWAAFGIQGLAPYWFELEATAYVGGQGRTALRFEAEYELLLTQRLILQPRFEANVYGKADPTLRIGSGFSDAEFGLRLRYEIRREFAPYIGVEWKRSFGGTADFARAAGESVSDAELVAGVRLWF